MKKIIVIIMGLFFCVQPAHSLSFIGVPSLSQSGGQWRVSFETDEYADVAVSIVNIKDSSIVRHLAGGVLGANAPAPLARNSLSQTLIWDGRDDLGAVAAHPESLSVRVRAGMRVRLLDLVGDNPYAFDKFLPRFNGIAPGPDNTCYVAGSAGTLAFLNIRQYDANGVYIRTVSPFPHGMQPDSARAFGTNLLPGGKVIPKTVQTYYPQVGSALSSNINVRLHSIGESGDLFMTYNNTFQIMNKNGVLENATPVKLVTFPALPASPHTYARITGPCCIAPSADPRYLYLSGYYAAFTSNGYFGGALDTGFWVDGRVFKLEKNTGVATPFIALDSVPLTVGARDSAGIIAQFGFSALQGVDIDDSGHVFVCDRLHKRVSVYDTNAVLLGSITVPFPDLVKYNRRNGALYVLCRSATMVVLKKYQSWRNGSVPVCTVLVTTQMRNNNLITASMELVPSAGKERIWVGYYANPVKIYEDAENQLALYRDFDVVSGKINTGFDRVVVDRTNETVYIDDAWAGMYKVEDWNHPVLVGCSTSLKKPLYANDFTISPRHQLYLKYGWGSAGYKGPIARYSLDHYHAPLPFANTGNNIVTPYIFGRFDFGWGDKGLAVTRQNSVVAMFHLDVARNDYRVAVFPDTGSADTSIGTKLVHPLSPQGGGVKVDRQGNVYFGDLVRSADHRIPAGFETDIAYAKFVGSVVKYNAGDTGYIDRSAVPPRAVGAARIYSTGIGPFGRDGSAVCVCRSPRFDLDDYGRLFIPNAVTATVTIIDNEGNNILRFGEYGNRDSRGGLPGVGQTLAEPAIPLAWPIGVAASEDFIYVTDMVNCRLARLKMEYGLDNLPGLTAHALGLSRAGETAAARPFTLVLGPNPFNPHLFIRLGEAISVPGGVRLSVYDCAGRRVKTVMTDARSLHSGIRWDASARGAGIYLIEGRCEDGRVFRQRAALVK